jgi:hypothetical protein
MRKKKQALPAKTDLYSWNTKHTYPTNPLTSKSTHSLFILKDLAAGNPKAVIVSKTLVYFLKMSVSLF